MAKKHLADARQGEALAGKVVAELKFVFWVSMFTRRHDATLWNGKLHIEFPNLPRTLLALDARTLLYNQLNEVRIFRNRIAHHEPIFARDLDADYRRIRKLVAWRSHTAADWLDGLQEVGTLLAARP
ncbi:MAG TPA: hypothetical protein VFE17_06970 [Candidatus Baltobacteraceae bacterium]|nr:hypothetical protein [Candidatus Baltobacteraceae bacterium]